MQMNSPRISKYSYSSQLLKIPVFLFFTAIYITEKLNISFFQYHAALEYRHQNTLKRAVRHLVVGRVDELTEPADVRQSA